MLDLNRTDVPDSGRWVFRSQVYVPSSFTGSSYFIMLNDYSFGGPLVWSVQVQFNGMSGRCECDCGSMPAANLPLLVRDEWTEIRAEIDLSADTLDVYYDGHRLNAPGYTWTEGPFGTSSGQTRIEAINFFPLSGPGEVYFDDARLEPRIEFGELDAGCVPTNNSTGQPGVLTAYGSPIAATNLLILRASDLPNEFGYFLASRTSGLYIVPPGASGPICLSQDIARFVRHVRSGPVFSHEAPALDLSNLPFNVPPFGVLVGDTVAFQCWYRDGGSSNFTNSTLVTFR
ncbi:MAG: hypothetical protein GY711_17260 [bacterium]|nr:hypothetical protein [bacterium]